MDEYLFEPGSALSALANAVPIPLFVVDEDVRILHGNAAALAFLNAPLPPVVRDLCGRVMQCIHERNSPEECGRTPDCDDCVIRLSVRSVVRHELAVVQRPCRMALLRDGQKQTVTFRVSAAPFEYGGDMLVVLAFENVQEAIAGPEGP